MSTDFAKIKNEFPFFSTQGGSRKNHPELVYFDNASTTQTCAPALKAMHNYYLKSRANVHRGVYNLASAATERFEAARGKIAKFINTEKEEIIFTSGTTHGLNQLAYTLAPRLTHRDNIVLTRMEHHANLVPWQVMAKHYGFEIRFVEFNHPTVISNELARREKSLSNQLVNGQRSLTSFEMTNGGKYDINLESTKQVIDKNTKIVSFTLASNVLGTVAPAEEIIKQAKAVGAITIIDAAQAVAHLPIDVKKMDCDFLVFSGHKMYGPTGIGVLYGKKEMLAENIEPFFFGGEMVKNVTYKNATWNDLPYKFEAGTPNIAGAIGLGAAAEFISKIGWEKILKHESELTEYALKKLGPLVKVFGPVFDCQHPPTPLKGGIRTPSLKSPLVGGRGMLVNRIGVISFTIPGVHPHDIAEIFNKHGIAVRAGLHCAEPLHGLFGLTGTTRISLGVYNTKKEIDRAVEAVKNVSKLFLKTQLSFRTK